MGHIVPTKYAFLFQALLCNNDVCKYLGTLGPESRINIFAHCTISLPSLCRLVWKHWTCKLFVRYILSSVFVRLNPLSQLTLVQYMGLCVFVLPLGNSATCVLYIVIIIKPEISIIGNCCERGHETMMRALCLAASFCVGCAATRPNSFETQSRRHSYL